MSKRTFQCCMSFHYRKMYLIKHQHLLTWSVLMAVWCFVAQSILSTLPFSSWKCLSKMVISKTLNRSSTNCCTIWERISDIGAKKCQFSISKFMKNSSVSLHFGDEQQDLHTNLFKFMVTASFRSNLKFQLCFQLFALHPGSLTFPFHTFSIFLITLWQCALQSWSGALVLLHCLGNKEKDLLPPCMCHSLPLIFYA